MGWESAVSTAYSANRASQQVQQGERTATAQAQEGTYQANNLADNTARTVGKLQTSFLQSGISLEGGPEAVISQALSRGQTDVGRTITNANNTALNTMTQARTAALDTIATSLQKNSGGLQNMFGGMGNGINDQSAYALNDMGFGNTAYDMLDPTP